MFTKGIDKLMGIGGKLYAVCTKRQTVLLCNIFLQMCHRAIFGENWGKEKEGAHLMHY